MSLQIGIVGLPNAGKSTLFNALTGNQVLAAAYPFATIEPNTGMVPVPDVRLDKLSEIYRPEKTIPATVQFLDIAGLVKGAHQGEGLGNKFLSHIRQTSAICQVVRAFESADVSHVEQTIDPKRDISTINTELALADLETLQNFLGKFNKLAKSDPKLKVSTNFLEKAKSHLDKAQPLRQTELMGELESIHPDAINLFNNLLTTKPVIYMFNIDEQTLANAEQQNELRALVEPSPALCVNAALEAELPGLDEKSAKELLASYDQERPALEELIRLSYKILGLITFFTVGPQEVKAWTVKEGSSAPQAAGVIHGDFQRGFIAAEVIGYDELAGFSSWNEAKAAGKIRTEGKGYVMKDGDVAVFRFNV